MTICISSHILEELSKIATDYGIIHNGSLLQEITQEELMKRCSERMELTLDHPKQAIPVLDSMGFTNYQVTVFDIFFGNSQGKFYASFDDSCPFKFRHRHVYVRLSQMTSEVFCASLSGGGKEYRARGSHLRPSSYYEHM